MTVAIGTYLLGEGGQYVDVDEAMTVRGGLGHGRNYVEGCLVIDVEGKELLGGDQPTDVDHLWAYLVPGLSELAARRSFEVWLPDAPVRLSFEVQERHPHRDLVRIEVGRRPPVSSVVPRRELINEFVRAGMEFHENLGRLVPTRAGDASLALEQLARLEAPGASSRVRYIDRSVRVRDGECELILDYILARALRMDVDAGERILQAGEALASPWRADPGACPDLGDLVQAVGGAARLRPLLEIDPVAITTIVGVDSSTEGRLAKVVARVGSLLES